MAVAALTSRDIAPQSATAAVQGFGKVGSGTARFLYDAGVRVLAVSDQYGAVHSEHGIGVPALEAHVKRTGSVVGFEDADEIPQKESLLTLAVDLLVPAAVEGVLNATNAADVRAKIIVEGANGPTTPDVDAILAAQGCLVVPDILANAGGVVVSYFEWV